MGVQTDVLIAGREDAQAIADTATPTLDWEGFTDVRELLVELAELAKSASLQGKWPMLWQSL